MSEFFWSGDVRSPGLPILLAAFLFLAAGTAALTGCVLVWLRRHAILDRPNERSSHTVATPRGGGLGLIPAVVAALCVIRIVGGGPGLLLPLLAAFLSWHCWRDDRVGLPASQRFVVQATAVAIGLAALPDGAVFQGWLPFWLDRMTAAIGWLWFLNLYNFMDGIDGITGVETASLGVGLILAGGAFALAGAVFLGAALGFLAWNLPPAKLFMGDVGSVPLGFLLGGLLLSLAAIGHWAPALILPLYYLADATLTLLRRLLRGERFWQAHRTHFYQLAVAGGRGHAEVAGFVLACNMLLVALSTAAYRWPVASLAAAFALVAVFLALLRRASLTGRA